MVLRTPRLRLEPLAVKHARALYSQLTDKRLYRFISDSPPSSVSWLEARYARLARGKSPDNKEDWLNWALWSLESGCYVGYVQATVRSADRQIIVAYVVFRQYWRQGLGTEAVSCMIAHLRRKYKDFEVLAFAEKQNLPSIALLRRLGFVEVLDDIRRKTSSVTEGKFVLANR
jgi:ribosomal-protein-alanine N-acetyltransferase